MNSSGRAEPLIIADPELIDRSDKFLTRPEMFRLDKVGLPIPSFTISEAAKVFWACRDENLRRRVQKHRYVLSTDDSCEHVYHRGSTDEQGNVLVRDEPAIADDGYTCVLCGGIDWGNRYRIGTMSTRYYSLSSIERMAFVDLQHGDTDSAQLIRIRKQVKIIAQAWRYLA